MKGNNNNKNCWSVYMHTNNINNKKYIGITGIEPKKRWGKNGSGYKRNKHFWRAIQKYGWENFSHEILFFNLSKDEACDKEKHLIKLYKSNDQNYGYNNTDGGDVGYSYSEKTRKKISDACQGKYKGENNPMYGISPEERMDKETYEQWLIKQKTNKLHGENHPMYGISPQERMDEDTYRQWREKRKDSSKNIAVICIETDVKYKSAREAERNTNIGHSSILKSCDSENSHSVAGGFHWRYADKYIPDCIIEQYKTEYKRGKRHVRCVETGVVYKTARNVKMALGFDDSLVNKCCKDKNKTCGGYHWEYIYVSYNNTEQK